MNDTPAAPTEPQGSPPSGKVSSEGTCCPEVSTFEGSRNPARVAGFDPRTNIVPPGSGDEYWEPPAKAKSAPSDLYKRDGARWCSVGLDQTIELEISFEGQSGNGCIANCSFEMAPGGVVSIETQTVAGNNSIFRLRGVAEGETSIRVMCQGAEIGWVHVVCYRIIQLKVTIGAIKTNRTRVPSYSTESLQRVLNSVFGQACINMTVFDVGTVDMTGNPYVGGSENGLHIPTTDGDMFMPSLDFNGSEMPFLRMVSRFAKPADGFLPLYFYVPNNDRAQFNGSVVRVGEGPGFVFKATDLLDSYSILAHEVGHIFGLLHPNQAGADQIPDHLYNSIGGQLMSEPATNTEPAINGNIMIVPTDRANIMALDPLNLMGYWPEFHEQIYLRKHQWDSCRALASNYERVAK